MSAFTDSFTDTSGTNLETHSASWVLDGLTPAGACKINASNQLKAVAAGGYRAPTTGSADHYAQFAYKGAVSSMVCVRFSDSDNFAAGVRVQGTNWEVWKRSGGTFTNLVTSSFAASGHTPATNDVIKLVISSGSGNITVSRNGTQITALNCSSTVNSTTQTPGVHPRAAEDPFLDDWQSDNLTVPNSISATDLTAGRVYAADADLSGVTHSVSGTYTGTATSIEAQFTNASGGAVLQAWAAISGSAPGGGTWSGTIKGPALGTNGMNVAFRLSNDHTQVWSGTNTFYAGLCVLMIGQSNTRNIWTFKTASPPSSSGAYTRRWNGFDWYQADAAANASEIDHVDNGAGTLNQQNNADGAVLLANRLASTFGCAIGLLEFAIGGTSITTWRNGGSSWTSMTGASTGLSASNAKLGVLFNAVYWHQGESDGLTASAMSKATYKSNLTGLKTELDTLCGRSNVPFGVVTLGRYGPGGNTDDSHWEPVRQAHLEVIRDNAASGFFYGATASDLPLATADAFHIDPSTGLPHLARRWAQSLAMALGFASHGGAGPSVGEPYWKVGTPTVLHLPVTQDGGAALKTSGGGTSGASLTGFGDDGGTSLVTVNGSARSVSSTAFSGGEILLTLSSALSPADAVTVAHQYGTCKLNTNQAYDDQTFQGESLGAPLRPTVGALSAAPVYPSPCPAILLAGA